MSWRRAPTQRLSDDSLASEQGFTLVELVIIVGIISLLAVPTTIAFLNFQRTQALNGAAQQMVNHLNQARQLAITANTSYKIEFDTTNNKLRFLRPATCSSSCTAWTGPGTDGSGWRTLENGAQIACAPSTTITFNYMGTGTSGTVQVKAATGTDSRYVTVGTTGRVRWSTTGTCS